MKAYYFILSHNDLDGYFSTIVMDDFIRRKLKFSHGGEIKTRYMYYHCDYAQISFAPFIQRIQRYGPADIHELAITDLNFKDRNFEKLVEFLRQVPIDTLYFIDHHRNSRETIENWRAQIEDLVGEFVEFIDTSRSTAALCQWLSRKFIDKAQASLDPDTDKEKIEHIRQDQKIMAEIDKTIELVDASDRYDQSHPVKFAMGRCLNNQFKRLIKGISGEDNLLTDEAREYRQFLITDMLRDLYRIGDYIRTHGHRGSRWLLSTIESVWLDNEYLPGFDYHSPIGSSDDVRLISHPGIDGDKVLDYLDNANLIDDITVDEVIETHKALVYLYDWALADTSLIETGNPSSYPSMELHQTPGSVRMVFFWVPEPTSLVNTLIHGLDVADVGAVFYPGDRVEIRSKAEDIDLSKVAAQFDGGGHWGAAGFPLEGKMTHPDIARKLIRSIDEQKKSGSD